MIRHVFYPLEYRSNIFTCKSCGNDFQLLRYDKNDIEIIPKACPCCGNTKIEPEDKHIYSFIPGMLDFNGNKIYEEPTK